MRSRINANPKNPPQEETKIEDNYSSIKEKLRGIYMRNKINLPYK